MLGMAGGVGAVDCSIGDLGSHDPEVPEGPSHPGIEASVGEQHDKEVLPGVNPDLGSGPPGVPVG